MGTLFSLSLSHVEISQLSCCQNLLFCPQPKASTAFSCRWSAVDGNDDACRSCDPSFQEVSRPSDVFAKAKDLPHVMSHQTFNQNSPEETGTFDFNVEASRRTTHSHHGNLKQPFAGLVKRGAGAGKLSSPCLQQKKSSKLWDSGSLVSDITHLIRNWTVIKSISKATELHNLLNSGWAEHFLFSSADVYVARETAKTYYRQYWNH